MEQTSWGSSVYDILNVMPNVLEQELLDQLDVLAAEVVTEDNLPALMKEGFEALDTALETEPEPEPETPILYDGYDSVGGNLLGTGATCALTNVIAEGITNVGGELEITEDGRYEVHADVTTQVVSGTDRSSSDIFLQKQTLGAGSWSKIDGTTRRIYNRQASDLGSGSCSINHIFDLVATDKIRIRGKLLAGTNQVSFMILGSSILIKKIS